MENKRMPVVVWSDNFLRMQIAIILGLMSFICIVKSTEVYAARIALGSLLISVSAWIVSAVKFTREMAAQRIAKEIE